VWLPLGASRGSPRAGDTPAVTARRCVGREKEPDDGDSAQHKLHSASWGNSAQAVSVRGLSNQELKRTPGRRAWGARVWLRGGQVQLNS